MYNVDTVVWPSCTCTFVHVEYSHGDYPLCEFFDFPTPNFPPLSSFQNKSLDHFVQTYVSMEKFVSIGCTVVITAQCTLSLLRFSGFHF